MTKHAPADVARALADLKGHMTAHGRGLSTAAFELGNSAGPWDLYRHAAAIIAARTDLSEAEDACRRARASLAKLLPELPTMENTRTETLGETGTRLARDQGYTGPVYVPPVETPRPGWVLIGHILDPLGRVTGWSGDVPPIDGRVPVYVRAHDPEHLSD